jgi:hypothetical protein
MVTGGFSAETTMAKSIHRAQREPSGGKVTKIELGDFLGERRAGPEHQALVRLIGSLAETLG